jgi:hypothetical protein
MPACLADDDVEDELSNLASDRFDLRNSQRLQIPRIVDALKQHGLVLQEERTCQPAPDGPLVIVSVYVPERQTCPNII